MFVELQILLNIEQILKLICNTNLNFYKVLISRYRSKYRSTYSLRFGAAKCVFKLKGKRRVGGIKDMISVKNYK